MSMTDNRENMSIEYTVCVLESIGNGLTLSNENDREDACVLAIQAIDKVQQFEAIGTIEEFKALKEKSVAKEMGRYSILGYEALCPICTKWVCKPTKFCPNCGQKLDWH